MSATAVTAQGRQPAAILRADSFIRVAHAQSRSVVFLHTIERDARRDKTEGLGSGVFPAERIPHAMWLAEPGTDAAVSVWREGAERTVRVILAAAPSDPGRRAGL